MPGVKIINLTRKNIFKSPTVNEVRKNATSSEAILPFKVSSFYLNNSKINFRIGDNVNQIVKN